jgi:hypothetical protein
VLIPLEEDDEDDDDDDIVSLQYGTCRSILSTLNNDIHILVLNNIQHT